MQEDFRRERTHGEDSQEQCLHEGCGVGGEEDSLFDSFLLQVLNFVREHTVKRASALAGNSVYVDRRFLSKYMPDFDDHLHYRIIDVSSVKEVSTFLFEYRVSVGEALAP